MRGRPDRTLRANAFGAALLNPCAYFTSLRTRRAAWCGTTAHLGRIDARPRSDAFRLGRVPRSAARCGFALASFKEISSGRAGQAACSNDPLATHRDE